VSLSNNGSIAVNHNEKEDMLYDFYNGLIGTEFGREHDIDLEAIGLPSLDLHELEVPFTMEEVWAAVKELPCDKAPGPDGFSGRFYQTAWPVIKEDVFRAVQHLFSLRSKGMR
jgi:hypothetical protein